MSFQAVHDLALCPHCLGLDSPPIVVRRKPDRQHDEPISNHEPSAPADEP